ncbi:hypothetical protein [Microbispora sp. ATCC PTA-5024]|uniref:hypothetical protein n=1 Tax=Microbispora sp. ATCC PTA-5024 TaxID=316330 RepID=UPI0003DCD87E|nr:hypothetical protein [Microbispora sp. ATCC PTA-5024]ETK37168.1 hypothetical protein MPTA5024_05200 [Microbispora sp. ATCC PTA-5024]
MAPTPASPWPATSSASGSPEARGGIAECLGGEVHLAYAERSGSGAVTVAAGFSPGAARARAEARASALDNLYRLPDGLAPLRAGEGDRHLGLADFMPRPPDDSASRVTGVGLLSRERYQLPVEVVWLGERDCRVEPTLVGVVDDGVSEAIADLLAHDVVIRWWSSPGFPLLRVSAYLDRLIPPGVVAAASALGLWVSAFVLPGPGFHIALVGVGGEGTTVATAAARTVRAAVGEAFLRAMAARAQPWNTLPTGDSLRRLTVWHRESDYLAYLERSAIDADPPALDEPAVWEGPMSWPDLACRRFGHEPILIGLDAPSGPVKVVCPGAACYRTAPPGTTLPCPVP